jgi:predicted MFS family arabinose efflux permease
MIYCLLYIVSCMSKHSPDFYVLLFGRLTGGMATSILFSSFESWYASAFRIRI